MIENVLISILRRDSSGDLVILCASNVESIGEMHSRMPAIHAKQLALIVLERVHPLCSPDISQSLSGHHPSPVSIILITLNNADIFKCYVFGIEVLAHVFRGY